MAFAFDFTSSCLTSIIKGLFQKNELKLKKFIKINNKSYVRELFEGTIFRLCSHDYINQLHIHPPIPELRVFITCQLFSMSSQSAIHSDNYLIYFRKSILINNVTSILKH